MNIVDRIPVVLTPSETATRLRFDPAKAGMPSLDGLITLAQRLMRPRAVYDASYIGAKSEGTVEVAGIVLSSPLLRANLEGANRAFPYIISVGPDLEREAAAKDDLLRQYYLEEIANIALEQAANWLACRIEERYGLPSLANLSPGSLIDWPITEQTKLFSIFGDTEHLVGVHLTDSLLMVPRKSISGILFPSEEGFVACQLCDRENCQGRKAPFNGVGPQKYT